MSRCRGVVGKDGGALSGSLPVIALRRLAAILNAATLLLAVVELDAPLSMGPSRPKDRELGDGEASFLKPAGGVNRPKGPALLGRGPEPEAIS